VPEWGGISHLYDTRFHHMSRDGGNIVLFHPRVEYSTIFIYSVRDETVLSRRRRRCEHNSQLAHESRRLPTDSVDNLETDQTDSIAV